ncbi:MAG: hypothetical protein P5683_07485 [Limnospira sp. PMC 1279.21]|nr:MULTISPECIES: hypothetical protein [unclassified Limnospira]QJB27951.1 hypothetical protein HFV01_21930 [Limnospira fusiformis SAG 85.79]MDT9180251.1 hypothetical protein [Limnospira sp. PMC 1238.20]MDT9223470.1 hypothetical protein [Limnospira sp. PMC 1279.21]MDT9228590.1 hypothetical protein [Limnospira sp. PMC 1242.20]MDT9255153.1 hypothetical protein [Limnospira sp. PMC 1254.20]
MRQLPMEFEINQNRAIAPNHLRNALAEIGAYSEKMEGDEPQEERAA